MPAWFRLVALLLILPPLSVPAAETTARAPMAAARLPPPIAARKPVRLVAHGIERTDNYAWLRAKNWRDVVEDPTRLPRDIRSYLEAENKYSDAVLAPLAELRAKLVAEMKGRIPPQDSGVPMPDGPYSYWQKYEAGAEHPIFVRAPRDGGDEEVLIDGNALARGKSYFAFGDSPEHSADHKYFAYTVDDTGAESYTLVVRDLESKRDLDVIKGVYGFTWADDTTLFYVRLDDELRARSVYRHRLGTDPADDPLVYEETDLQFSVSVSRTSNGRFIVISSTSMNSNEDRIVEASEPDSEPRLVQERVAGLTYELDEWGGDQLVIRTNAGGADDFKLVTTPISAPGRKNWHDLVPYREGRRIVSFAALANHLVRLERENGLGRIVIRRNSDGTEHAVTVEAEAYNIWFIAPYEHNSPTIRFAYASPSTPPRTYDYDLETRERVLRKEQHVPSGHDPTAYVVRRLSATTSDNEEVPITVLYRKDLALDGSAPLFIDGYGAYGEAFEANFDRNVFSLVDRGFVYAIAHVRGGIEKGERWHNAGRRENKPNALTDFIAVTEHLIATGYTSRGRAVARGEFAGGLLVAAVANMRPDLFAGMVARVPAADLLNSMLDETLPLTAGEFAEWGDPVRDPAAYRTIAGYSPYDNVTAQPYPHLLVTAGLSDSRVQYWEPAKWVAKLRSMHTNGARITLVTQMSAGHDGASGRFAALGEAALIAAFALDITDWREPGGGPLP